MQGRIAGANFIDTTRETLSRGRPGNIAAGLGMEFLPAIFYPPTGIPSLLEMETSNRKDASMIRNPLFPALLAGCCSLALLGCARSEAKKDDLSQAEKELAKERDTNKDNPPKKQTVTVSLVTPQELGAAIEKHKGQVVLVDFWATWCIPCIKNFPHTVEWQKGYGDKGLAVISVSMDDTDEEKQTEVLEFLKKQNATFTNFQSKLGGDEEGMQGFQIPGGAIPYYKLYDKTGKLAKTFEQDPCNPFDAKDIEAAIQEALK